ncbi:MAG: hypothetical protein R3F56_02980 [Planctomycetota bacterium]
MTAARFFGLGRQAQGDGWQPALGAEVLARGEDAADPWRCLGPAAVATVSAYRGDPRLEQ